MTRILMLALAAGLAACAHYQSGPGYRSTGEFKTSSDYPSATSPATTSEKPPANAEIENYRPRAGFKLSWPVQPVKINRGFRPQTDPAHQGIDFGGPRNAPILAAHEGVVIYAGRHFHGYGNMIIVEYSDQWATLYAHLNKITVKEGRAVLPGDVLGKMGRTGRASGVHLHFELMHNRVPVDPLPFLSGPPRVTAKFKGPNHSI